MSKLKQWEVHASQPYFYHDPEGDGFVYFTTEAERDSEANRIIKEYINGENQWDDAVTNIVCGTLTGKSTAVNIEYPDGEINDEGYDEAGVYFSDSDSESSCEYELVGFEKEGNCEE